MFMINSDTLLIRIAFYLTIIFFIQNCTPRIYNRAFVVRNRLGTLDICSNE